MTLRIFLYTGGKSQVNSGADIREKLPYVVFLRILILGIELFSYFLFCDSTKHGKTKPEADAHTECWRATMLEIGTTKDDWPRRSQKSVDVDGQSCFRVSGVYTNKVELCCVACCDKRILACYFLDWYINGSPVLAN